MRPHRWQPIRLPRLCDSPGKNTGVGCHFLLQCMKVKSESEVAQPCLTLSNPMGCSLPGSSVHGIFQARVLEWGAIAFSKAMSYVCLSFPQCLADPSPLIITLIAHLACKALLCWWFHLVFSPVLRGREGGMGKVTHLISHLRMLRPRASCVTCPAYEAGCQRLILQMERGSLTFNTVCFPLIFYYFIWMVLISLEIDLTSWKLT